MGIFQNNLLAGAAAAASAGGGAFYDYQIEQSARFSKADNSYLVRTYGTVTDNKKVTYSWWGKKAGFGSTQMVFFVVDATGGLGMEFTSADKLTLSVANSGARNMTGDRVYRDPSGWTHFLYAVDTTQASNDNRLRFYVNGVEDTSSAYNSSQTQDGSCSFNLSSTDTYFSNHPGNNIQSDFYIAEFIHVDGQQLTPTDFGEFKNGVFIPIDYAGTYGNEGARLKFENASDLGNDSSGNNNDWTVSGMGADHQVLDSPTFGS